MTTNQTIDGVPRELLELCVKALASTGYTFESNELRALLDAPTVESELDRLRGENERLLAGFYQQVTDADIKKISDYMGNPDMPTGAFLRQDAYDLANMTTHMCREVQALRNKLAAQPQGVSSDVISFGTQVEKLLCKALGREWSASGISIESLVAQIPEKAQGEPVAKSKPVAKLHAERLTGKDGEYGITVEDSQWFNTCRLTGGEFNLYAEQPAPVAAVKLGTHHVLGAIHNVDGFPGVTGFQIKTLTDLLNSAITGQ